MKQEPDNYEEYEDIDKPMSKNDSRFVAVILVLAVLVWVLVGCALKQYGFTGHKDQPARAELKGK